MIPYGRQDITEADVNAVIDVLRSDFLTQGPIVPRFETVVSGHVGANYGVAVNSATSALHIACLALGVGPGDWVWTSPITFVASSNSALYCGAKVDFVDVDPRTYNLCADALEAKLRIAESDGRLPKVVIAVHLCGQACDMRSIHALAHKYGFKIIEDASHAVGAKYLGEYVGSSNYSDITVFSFHPVKIVTTAEGGMAVTNDASLAERMSLFRSHGVTRDPDLMTKETEGAWYYQQIELGYNYRMTEIQAALGISQMTRLDEYVSVRQALAKRYDDLLDELPLILPWQHPDTYSAYHIYPVRLKLDQIARGRRQVFDLLREAGIGVNVHYIPVHLQPYYIRMGFKPGDFPEAEKYYAEGITLPLYPTMGTQGQDQVIQSVTQALNR
ncbi:UDP-4-amino-4,6-dideoxy-N-acetyl-beta-L-altrosamine transaminase [Agrobacterium sp. rho-13.3]|uniref:UDP-4-amino-4, 6-dideoxy-N-acetyl-beta-L-altrosamine transaminase n=1 Tax=Agrobacterium sp. rho-13.3 TaxID=3072980 RepID=UPI002A0C6020|nr:UDP-4-amino-4,6-dideoxy-N-acetyl-beta-L-altrosamine transaminase [Agrobacterium sp. rho-13.3]MDX8309897.1 UDP-4-amino-4,6-dideoxy-N-acetyl-beta-L-altrosamine transaminase [Agrobacterium sp. rho-13.3]